MTVNSTKTTHRYTPGSAMLAERIPFMFRDASAIVVTQIDTATRVRVPVAADNYTVTGDGAAGTADIRALVTVPGGAIWLIKRRTAVLQKAAIPPHQPLPAAALEQSLDRVVLGTQEANRDVVELADRAIKLPEDDSSGELPRVELRRDTILGFDKVTGAPTTIPVADLRGAPAPEPQRYDAIAVEGQTRIPVTGPLIDNDGNIFDPDIRFVKLVLNSSWDIHKSEFTFTRGAAPFIDDLLLALPAGTKITVYGSPAESSLAPPVDPAQITTVAEHRLPGDTHDFQAIWRGFRKGFRRFIPIAGLGLGALLGAEHAGKYIATAVPFVGLLPGETDASDPRNYEVARGNLALPDDGLPGAGMPMHGLQIVGDGETVWKQYDNYAFYFNSKSADVANNLRRPYFADFTVEGLGGAPTQNGHIFAVGGMSSPLWERVRFTEPGSDGVCFQPSPNPDNETHNFFPTFRDCVFDGGLTRGRNCISVEDAVFGVITGCKFRNWCTDSDGVSVAAIDFESREQRFQAVGGWSITDNVFEDIDRAAIALYLNGPDYYDTPASGFSITNNKFYRCKRWLDMAGGFDEEVDAAISRHAVTVTGNFAAGVGDLRIQGMVGVRVTGNTLIGLETIKLGDQNLGKGNRQVNVDDNTLFRTAALTGIVVVGDAKSTDCSFSNNSIIDCGIQANTTSPGYLFIARYGETGIRTNGNRVFNPNGRIKAGFLLVSDVGGATMGATSEKIGNRVFGTPYTVTDTFNPPSPITGLAVDYTITGNPTLTGYGNYFDVTIAGARNTQFFVAKLNRFVSSSIIYAIVAGCTHTDNVVRVTIPVFNGSIALAAGDKISVRELVV